MSSEINGKTDRELLVDTYDAVVDHNRSSEPVRDAVKKLTATVYGNRKWGLVFQVRVLWGAAAIVLLAVLAPLAVAILSRAWAS